MGDNTKPVTSRKRSKQNEKLKKFNVYKDTVLSAIRDNAQFDTAIVKSNENYKTLQLAISDVEEHLQAARRLYNANVSLYNQLLVSFPSSSIAKNKGMVKKDFFEADEIKKNDVKIDL